MPFRLDGNAGQQVGVALAEGKKFLTSEQANVTLYIDEFNT
jgi:hypothetical protein